MKCTRWFGAAVVAVGVVTAEALVRAEIIEQVLVKVNGEIFTKSDLETRQVATLRQRNQQFDPKNEDRKSTRLNSSHIQKSRMPSSA